MRNLLPLLLLSLLLPGCLHTEEHPASTPGANLEEGEIILQEIEINVDGNLAEWADISAIPLTAIKDAGITPPEPEDFHASARIAWNRNDPTRLYFSFSAFDDEDQFDQPANRWWHNDTAELIIQDPFGNLLQWAFSNDGKSAYSTADTGAAEWAMVREGNHFKHEIAIDLSSQGFHAEEVLDDTGSLLITVQYNDGEGGSRQHQLGWRTGDTWTTGNFGRAYLGEKKAVEPPETLADMIAHSHLGTNSIRFSGKIPSGTGFVYLSDEGDRGTDESAWENAYTLEAETLTIDNLFPEKLYTYRTRAVRGTTSFWSAPKTFTLPSNVREKEGSYRISEAAGSPHRWSFEHLPSGIQLEEILVLPKIVGKEIDPNELETEFIFEAAANENSPDRWTIVQRHPLYEITQTVHPFQDGRLEIQTDFINVSNEEYRLKALYPILAQRLSLSGNLLETMTAGDARSYADGYRLQRAYGLTGNEEFFGYFALENPKSSEAVALGQLSNLRAESSFTAEKRSNQFLRISIETDYEKIPVSPGEQIEGERILLQFGNSGITLLDRLGTRIAETYGVNATTDHPIDLDVPESLYQFNFYSHYGSAVIDDFPSYSHRSEQFAHPYEDPAWVERNRQAGLDLGLGAYGYYAETTVDYPMAALGQPLVRNYGRPDFWFPDAQTIFDSHPDYYINGMADFSRPELIEIEENRARSAFETPASIVLYDWDFVNHWTRLPGQYDPSMTSIEAYRAALAPWKQLAKEDSPWSLARVYMNIITHQYGIADIIHIGADSDHGYYPEICGFLTGLTSQISGRWFYNGKLWWNNPDTFHVYAGGLYTYEMGKVHASYTALSGNVSSLGEPFADEELPVDRLDIIKKVSPTTADTAIAVDMFRNNPARTWHLPIDRDFGNWSIVGLFNLDEHQRGRPSEEKIQFRELGLETDTPYLIWEFWNEEFIGIGENELTRNLDAIDCEVLTLLKLEDHPQLLSNDRHIRQAGFDLTALDWNPEERTLSGTSRVVGSEPHRLFIHVPEGYLSLGASSGGVPLETSQNDSILTVQLPLRQEKNTLAHWIVQF